MRVPLSWLREYVDLPEDIEELAERLTLAGLEVAKIEYLGLAARAREGGHEEGGRATLDWEGIYIGEVLEVKPHPNADKLVIAVVDYGRGPRESVTGAPNIRVGDHGQKVAVAEPGARIIDAYGPEPKPVKVKAAAIRGVRSEVVLCSEKELGLSDDHSGVLILEQDLKVGTPLSELLQDVVLELDLTPNLARCFPIIGVAREVAALTGQRFKTPEVEWHPTGPGISGQVEVEIWDPDLCARYTAALVRGVKVGPSPFWMRRRLTLAGMRPINNIVDITNYVMLEWGQPLHAFDYRRLHSPDGPGKRIIVRRARPGERIVTLDGVERALTEEMLLIADPEGPIALAGVMGGLETEVTASTADVLIESASFSSTNNRRTAQALRLMSEAAARFGRGVPPELAPLALKRAAQLMRELAGGEIASGIVDVYPVKQKEVELELDPREVERLLGLAVPRDEIIALLERLEFACHPQGEAIRVKVPWHRLDVSCPADLVEEVARLIGYDKIPATLMAEPLPPQHRDRTLELEEQVREILVSCGLSEVITYSLTSPEAGAKLDPNSSPEDYLHIANPLSRERSVLRRLLLPGLLETVAENLKHRERVAIFELGRVYLPAGKGQRPREPRRLGIALAGPRERLSWHVKPRAMSFFDLKGIIEELLRGLGLEGRFERPSRPHPSFHPGRTAKLLIGGEEVGLLGELHPRVKEAFELELEWPVLAAELDLEAILALARATPVGRYRPLPQFPAVLRDLAIVVDEAIPAERVAQAIKAAGGELLRELVLFDLYQGPPIPKGKKSLAFRLRLQAEDRTLTDEEADRLRLQIEARLAEELGAELRK
ncbi:MAG: phenylalanine--tRNA ligase subunit beta [Candidatus Acetothermia bacterium]|jgi:phenylalanyl-tRNA synthetase beta chain|nr:phenylalanine--tRNA ligase subunit beta [Candidatus Acetothermia bacterium]MDH7505903.1 phenylalanine--tRNA ligase subunit beta [Candidatus Acetothermia bacterium]